MAENGEVVKKLTTVDPSHQETVNVFLDGSQHKSILERRALVFRFVKTVVPKILERVTGLVWRIMESVQEAFKTDKLENALLLETA